MALDKIPAFAGMTVIVCHSRESGNLITVIWTQLVILAKAGILKTREIKMNMYSESEKDTVQRFLFEHRNIRGEIVRLDQSFSAIMSQHAYPKPIQVFLGQTLAAAVSLTSSMKFKGQLTIQFASEGPVKLLVAKCNNYFHIRGLAQWQQDATRDELQQGMQDGNVVVTIHSDEAVKPYQSIVPLQGYSLTEALEHYFVQSEQIPTRFFCTHYADQLVGILLQMMPFDDAQEEEFDVQFWQEIVHKFEGLDNEILFNGNENLLGHLFPDESIRVFDSHPISFQCSCSIPRMEDAIRTVGRQEASELLLRKPIIVVTCEFCNSEYDFSREDVERIFSVQDRNN